MEHNDGAAAGSRSRNEFSTIRHDGESAVSIPLRSLLRIFRRLCEDVLSFLAPPFLAPDLEGAPSDFLRCRLDFLLRLVILPLSGARMDQIGREYCVHEIMHFSGFFLPLLLREYRNRSLHLTVEMPEYHWGMC